MHNITYTQFRDEIVKSAMEHKKPVFGHFELTARCNLDCKMCYVHNQNNAEYLHKELTTEQWKKIFDAAFENDLLYASLSGGECLLRKDFKELYLYLWNKNLFVTVQTNGTLINEDYVEFFKTYPPDKIQISLYGCNEEGYIRVTGHKGFERTVSSIRALMDAGITVFVSITPTAYLKGDDYINAVRFCKENKFLLNNTTPLLLPNRDNPEKDDYYLSEDEIVSLSVRRAMLDGELIPVECTPEVGGPMKEDPPNGLYCTAGNCLATILWDGRMYPCYNALIGDGASVLKMSYEEAWKKTVQLASTVLHCSECVGCPYDKTCPSCRALRMKDPYSGHCKPEICEMTRKLVAAGVKKLEPVE